ncbi:unnamed protein product, partial [Ectocarpus sp. 13 AM-2016]
ITVVVVRAFGVFRRLSRRRPPPRHHAAAITRPLPAHAARTSPFLSESGSAARELQRVLPHLLVQGLVVAISARCGGAPAPLAGASAPVPAALAFVTPSLGVSASGRTGGAVEASLARRPFFFFFFFVIFKRRRRRGYRRFPCRLD